MLNFKFIIISALLAIILSHNGPVCAQQEDLADFRLALAGYSIGMTYDESSYVRPFQYTKNLKPNPGIPEERLVGVVEDVYLDGIEVDILVYFHKDRIRQINIRFNPSLIEEMVRRMKAVYGSGKDKSRTVTYKNGLESHQRIYRWDFPHSKVDLVGISSNQRYGTLSLSAKTVDTVVVANTQ